MKRLGERVKVSMISTLVLTMISAMGTTQMIGVQDPSLQGITFDSKPGHVFLPVRELGKAVRMYVDWDNEKQQIIFGEIPVTEEYSAQLFDDSNLVSVNILKEAGYTVTYSEDEMSVEVSDGYESLRIFVPKQFVEISIREQKLRAWQGSRLIMETNISSGASGHSTPRGTFETGPIKQRRKYSSLYNNAPMPFSVQVTGHIFMHGSSSVPRRPASHGCIRMPLTGRNAAKYMYEWVHVGVPVVIATDWTREKQEAEPVEDGSTAMSA